MRCLPGPALPPLVCSTSFARVLLLATSCQFGTALDLGRAARLRTPLSARAPSILRIQLTIALSSVPSSHLSCCCCCCSRRHRVRVSAQGANEDRQANERDRGGGRPGWIWTMDADSLCLCCHLCGGTQQHPSPTRRPSIVSFTTAQWARLRVRILCARAPARTNLCSLPPIQGTYKG